MIRNLALPGLDICGDQANSGTIIKSKVIYTFNLVRCHWTAIARATFGGCWFRSQLNGGNFDLVPSLAIDYF